jgi:hypothetical protein
MHYYDTQDDVPDRLAEIMASHIPTKAPNRFRHEDGGTTVIFIDGQKYGILKCEIDSRFYDLVKPFRWCARKHQGALHVRTNVRIQGKRTIRKMRQILPQGASLVVSPLRPHSLGEAAY